ncbi:MAG: AraC family transcriptional regulator [Ruminococcus sp.]|nr:AraC family transcriptional regulator [Ruminococcus sp.]
MAVNQNIYPYSAQVKSLPVYLAGIGGSEYQYHVRRPEGYQWHQILYSAKGRGCLKYGGVSVNLTEGYYFFLPAFCPHEYYPVRGDWDVRWTAFDGSACTEILGSLDMTKPFAVKLTDSGSLQKLYAEMFNVLRSDIIYGNFTCSGLIYQYIIELHKLASDKTPAGGGRSSILMPVLDYIESNFRNGFSLTLLAERAGITPQHLCRIFRKTMNMRPSEYLTRRRLTEAKKLLTETDMPVSRICVSSGFADPGYFSAVFRQYEGLSPSEYRKNYRPVR